MTYQFPIHGYSLRNAEKIQFIYHWVQETLGKLNTGRDLSVIYPVKLLSRNYCGWNIERAHCPAGARSIGDLADGRHEEAPAARYRRGSRLLVGLQAKQARTALTETKDGENKKLQGARAAPRQA
jgi:hypothetical protein